MATLGGVKEQVVGRRLLVDNRAGQQRHLDRLVHELSHGLRP